MQTANLGFIATVLLIEATPGPNMAYLAALTLAEGRSAGVRAIAGIATGMLLLGTGAAYGMTALLTQSAVAWNALRWAGSGYLLWLAWDAWRDADAGAVPTHSAGQAGARYFIRGVTTNLLNPKAALFFAILLPEFVDRAHPPLPQTLVLTAISVAIAAAVHGGIVLVADQAHPWLVQAGSVRAGRTRLVRRGMALALIGIALWFALATKR